MIADIFLGVKNSPYLQGIDQEIGAEFIDVNAIPPRMVWVPAASTFQSGGGIRGRTNAAARTPATRFASVRIRVWGKATGSDLAVDDIRATEQLLSNLVVALNDYAHGSVTFDSADWVSADGQEVTQYGRALDLTVTFQVPVVRSQLIDGETTAQILVAANAEVTGRMDFPPLSETVAGPEDGTGTPAP